LVAARRESPFQPPLAKTMGSWNTPPTEGAAVAEVVFLPFAPLAAAVVLGAGAWATWTTATPVIDAEPPRAGEEAEPEVVEGGGAEAPVATVGGIVGGAVGVVAGTVVGAVVVDGGGCVVGVVLGTVV
jgi:hypothetical protein